ncbi:transposase [Vibrio parahaemolyticus]|uniref:transposase n=1 Tax=Vibrio parahaemolyticus TaxID=670 RepID=UPI00356B6560
MSAWLGLVPRQNSTGGKSNLGGISKRGNVYLRRQVIHGAKALKIHMKRDKSVLGQWVDSQVRGDISSPCCFNCLG